MKHRRTTIVRLHPRGDKIPKGWRLVGSAGRHRDRHAVLIEKIKPLRHKRLTRPGDYA